MKKILTVLLFCVLTIGMASVASAAEWQPIRNDYDDWTWVFDGQSFKRMDYKTYSVWLKLEYPETAGAEIAEALKLKAPVAYAFRKHEYNFQDEKSRVVALALYDKKGNTLYSFSDPTQWKQIFPNSIDASLFNATYDYYKKHYK